MEKLVDTRLLLAIDGVSRSFPGVRALDNVTFHVNAGEVHGLIGENGAGKSTLMAIASGALAPDTGRVTVAGQDAPADPEYVKGLGLAIVRQEPALMPDLTVAENLYLGLPEGKRPSARNIDAWAADLLKRWSNDINFRSGDRVLTLNPEQRFIVEIVKALAAEPTVLVLDEPTEHLPSEDVERLFERIREVVARGASVVYISHRIREVRRIADRVTVLRDGQGQGTYNVADLSEDEIVALIVGSAIDREFPSKLAELPDEPVFEAAGLTGDGFRDVHLRVGRGEILGLAGIDGNGQREFMRALAGLSHSSGAVHIDGRRVSVSNPALSTRGGIRFLAGDRHREGMLKDLSVRENFSLRSIDRDAIFGIVNQASERRRADEAIEKFAVKTPTAETPIRSLSGGNQQKVVLASVLASQPKVLLIDEPTHGVDVGARAEIYRVLREASAQGLATIVVSSDAQELAGLSDRLAIFSRGQVVDVIEGDRVTENNITASVLKSTSVRDYARKRIGEFWKWAAGDVAPLVMVAVAILIMGVVASVASPYYLSGRSLAALMSFTATLAIVSYGQQSVMLVGGIDLSVGPLMGLVQVLASFFIVQGLTWDSTLVGSGVILLACVGVGMVNWALVDLLRLHPMVATLATYMSVQAISLLLRAVPTGMFDAMIMKVLSTKIGIVPASIIFAMVLAFGLEFVLYKTNLGFSFRGFGSQPEAARIAGISPRFTLLRAYVGCSLLTGLAAITFMQHVGIGDPRAGINYTLQSIAAVAIGGASLFGARGSFLGALLGAAFITQVNAVTSFLQLDQAFQNYLLGGMIILAVALYSKSRQLVIAR